MRTLLQTLTAASLILLGATLAGAQDFGAELPREEAVPPPEDFYEEFPETGPATGKGIISAAIKAGNPIILISPVAPEYYGDGREFVSFDPETGEPKGLKLISVEW